MRILALLLLFGVLITVAVIGWQKESAPLQLPQNEAKESSTSSFASSITIHYSSASKNTKSEQNTTTILYQGEDSKQKFLFVVSMDRNKSSLPPLSLRRYYLIEGKIDGSHFILKIPKGIQNIEDLNISIRSNETNRTITIDPTLLSDITTLGPNDRMRMNIDFEHPENIDIAIETKEQILPVPR